MCIRDSLEIAHFGGERVVAFLQVGVGGFLPLNLRGEHIHLPLPAHAEPQPVLQPAEQGQQHQSDQEQRARAAHPASALD